jgi:general bacterial porin, GBP family
MQRCSSTLIAAATALLAYNAHAESAITLYGTVDGGFQFLSKDRFGKRQTVFQDSPAASNRFGARGEYAVIEDMQLTFNVEGRYFLNGNGPGAQYASNSNVVSRLFDRGANIGLNTKIGQFRLGLINNPVTGAHVAGDIRPAINSGGGVFAWYRNRQINSTCQDGYCDFTFLQRALSYKSPALAGLTASGFYVSGSGNRDANTTGSDNNGGYGLALNFTAAPFSGNLGVQQMMDQSGVKIGQVALLNAGYTSGPWAMRAGTTQFKQFAGGVLYRLSSTTNVAAPATTPTRDQTNRQDNVGVSFKPNEATTLYAAAYRYTRKGDAAQKIDLVSLGLDYALGKRATSYVIVSGVKNGSAANQSAGFYALTTAAGASNTAISIGVRANFDIGFKL